MNIKLFDSEIKVMEVLWKEGDLTAKQLADILSEKIGWNKNTTYTVIKNVSPRGLLNVMEIIICANL